MTIEQWVSVTELEHDNVYLKTNNHQVIEVNAQTSNVFMRLEVRSVKIMVDRVLIQAK